MAEIFTFHSDNERSVKIVGRVTFVQSEGLANYFLNGQVKEKCQVFFDMANCESMDSTFMGTIVQVSLFITESSANLTILNISDYCLSLLEELGVASFLSFDTQEKFEREWTLLPINQISNDNQKKHVYNAHKTLSDIYEPNKEEFKFVLKYLNPDNEEKGDD